jgi:transcriptional regulator with XRE-family HTH domain
LYEFVKKVWYNGLMTTDFYGWINAKIANSGLPKKEVAERAGISASLVYAVTTDGREPSLTFCVKVAKVLTIPTNEMLERAGFPTVPGPADITDPALRECWYILNDLSPSDLDCVLRQLRGLAAG